MRLAAGFGVVLGAGVIAGHFAGTSADRSTTECLMAPCGGSAVPGPGQDTYREGLRKDEQSFDHGVLTYSPLGTLGTSAISQFKVVVTDVGRHPQHVQFASYHGMAVYQPDIPTGGLVGVRIVGGENLKWQQQSSPEQEVLARGASATWYWQISAGMPGPAEITLRVDTYDQGSGQTLHEEMFRVSGNVTPSPAYQHQQHHKMIAGMAKGVAGGLVKIGSVATAILAMGAVAGRVAARRRNWSKMDGRKKDQRRRPRGSRNRKRQVSRVPGRAGHKPVRRMASR